MIFNILKRKDKNHNNNNDDELSIKCNKCTMRFKDKNRLTTHKKIAHSGKGEKKKETSQYGR